MDNYIDKFEYVVDLMRVTGNYTAVFEATTIWVITSDVETFLAVKDYVTLGNVKARVTEVVNSKTFKVNIFNQVIGDFGVWKSLAPYSDYGTRKTINAKLFDKNGGEFSYQKYPLIALRLPAPVDTVDGVTTLDAVILFCTFTSKTYKPQERIAQTFKPILYPLVEKFIKTVRASGEFHIFEKDLNYTQVDRMFYGTESGDDQNIKNVFDDPLDVVEIRNLRLRFIMENCPAPLNANAGTGDGGFPYVFEKVFES